MAFPGGEARRDVPRHRDAPLSRLAAAQLSGRAARARRRNACRASTRRSPRTKEDHDEPVPTRLLLQGAPVLERGHPRGWRRPSPRVLRRRARCCARVRRQRACGEARLSLTATPDSLPSAPGLPLLLRHGDHRGARQPGGQVEPGTRATALTIAELVAFTGPPIMGHEQRVSLRSEPCPALMGPPSVLLAMGSAKSPADTREVMVEGQ